MVHRQKNIFPWVFEFFRGFLHTQKYSSSSDWRRPVIQWGRGSMGSRGRKENAFKNRAAQALKNRAARRRQRRTTKKTVAAQGDGISARKWDWFNRLNIGLVSRTIRNRGPRVSFFLQETLVLKALVWTTITPKKEEDFVSITSQGQKASHKKPTSREETWNLKVWSPSLAILKCAATHPMVAWRMRPTDS